MNELAQYFTREPFSALLADSINCSNPKMVVDLGIGNGALTSAAQKKWKDAAFWGVDVDSERVAKLSATHSYVNLFNLNSLDSDLSIKLNIKVGSVDIAICNPPYKTLQKTAEFSRLLEVAGLLGSKNLISFTTDLLFLAQNLSLLKDGGTLGIILPAGLICGHNFELFRKDLLENHSVQNVIELEARIFSKTDAKTFILILKKGRADVGEVVLSLANHKGSIVCEKKVSKDELYHRMDYTYHAQIYKPSRPGILLKDMVQFIRRGNLTNLRLRSLGIPYFHTTDFKHHTIELQSENHEYDDIRIQSSVARGGDLLLGRVGKSCHQQVLMVTGGQIVVSDCVYILRPRKGNQFAIYSHLVSERGNNNLKSLKHGVCAQVISKRDLENIVL